MSGRVRVTLADGRRVTGFRKTLAQRSRTPQHLLPDWTLTFQPPASFTWHLAPGPFPGVMGASVGELGRLTITGKNKDFVLRQAALVWSKLCHDRAIDRVSAVLARADEPGPTASGPVRKGETIACTLHFDSFRSIVEVVAGSALRRIAYPVSIGR